MRLISLLILLLASGLGYAADPVQQLREFIARTDTARFKFDQEITQQDGSRETSVGTLDFLRPDRFRLEYFDPVGILMVHNGSNYWIYDKPINQVIISDSEQDITVVGFLVVLADPDLDKKFILSKEVQLREDLNWVRIEPRDREQIQFQKSELGLDASGQVKAVTILDLEGNTISVRFSEIDLALKDTGQYDFQIPVGAEVFRESF